MHFETVVIDWCQQRLMLTGVASQLVTIIIMSGYLTTTALSFDHQLVLSLLISYVIRI